MSKRPAFQFYPCDWRTDAGLRLCSIAARGLWIEMIAIMHEGEPYGHLTIQGRAVSPDMLGRLAGEGAGTIKKLLAELASNEVFSRTEAGVIFSRRMVRDEDLRERRAAAGAAGGEHGAKGGSHGKKGGRPRRQENPPNEEAEGGFDTPLIGSEKPPPSSPSPASRIPFDKSNGAAVDLDKRFWDDAVAYLGGKRSLIGKWVRDFGKDETKRAITAAQTERAVDPPAYVEKTLRRSKAHAEEVPIV
jgi:hypothetical protein